MKPDTTPNPSPGRRERNMAAKLARISDAARRLFFERGFDDVTTAEIADAADVATGTVFRYAPTKGELLVLVYNGIFEAAMDDAIATAQQSTNSLERVTSVVLHLLDAASEEPGLALIYQREVLFGSAGSAQVTYALDLIRRLEFHIATELTGGKGPDTGSPQKGAETAARSIFAVLHLAIVASAAGQRFDGEGREALALQVRQIAEGYAIDGSRTDS